MGFETQSIQCVSSVSPCVLIWSLSIPLNGQLFPCVHANYATQLRAPQWRTRKRRLWKYKRSTDSIDWRRLCWLLRKPPSPKRMTPSAWNWNRLLPKNYNADSATLTDEVHELDEAGAKVARSKSNAWRCWHFHYLCFDNEPVPLCTLRVHRLKPLPIAIMVTVRRISLDFSECYCEFYELWIEFNQFTCMLLLWWKEWNMIPWQEQQWMGWALNT